MTGRTLDLKRYRNTVAKEERTLLLMAVDKDDLAMQLVCMENELIMLRKRVKQKNPLIVDLCEIIGLGRTPAKRREFARNTLLKFGERRLANRIYPQ